MNINRDKKVFFLLLQIHVESYQNSVRYEHS